MKITVEAKVEGDKIILDLSPSQLEKLTTKKDEIKLSFLNPGDEFLIGKEAFIVLEQEGETTKAIAKNCFDNEYMEFGDNSDWKESNIRKFLHSKYLDEISDNVGENNIVSMNRDLTSLDGLDDYGTCLDVVSLLTVTEYAKYHKILGLKSHYPDGWWLITPASTPSNSERTSVCIVTETGSIALSTCDYDYDFRPFITLNSAITVSKC